MCGEITPWLKWGKTHFLVKKSQIGPYIIGQGH